MKKLLFLFTVISLNVTAQKGYTVLDWKGEYSLNTYLLQKMHEQYDSRRKALEKALASKNGIEGYIENTRVKFLQVVGNLPPSSPLNAKVTGTIQKEGYKIEKIIFESFASHHVTANLYVPQGSGRFPAALLFCGHEAEAKATVSYQKTAILFAKNGFVVLVIDPVSQGERYQLTGENGKPLTRGGTTEHTLINEVCNLAGTSAPAYELWDNKRALDYLVTRPEVDTAKIGCLGNSGGGMQTIYFASFEKRIKVIAPCSYLANRERTLELSGAADGCAQMPDEGREGLELSDYLISAAPRPLLILAGRYDFIDYTGTVAAFDELRKVYNGLGHPKSLKLFTWEDGHGISRPKREAAVTWFRQWFYNDSTPVKEADLETLPEKELLCTTSGQLNVQYANETNIFQQNLNIYNASSKKWHQFSESGREKIQQKVKDLLAIDNASIKVSAEQVNDVVNDRIVFHKLILRREGEIPLPVLIVYPAGTPKKVVVWLNEAGKQKIADSVSLLQTYLRQGSAVIMCDVRGIGETEDRAEFNDAKYYNKEYRNAMLSLHIGKSLTGQRVTDILTLLSFIGADRTTANLLIEINASGKLAIPALHALLFDDRITHLNLYHAIRSYREILENPLNKDWYSYVVPGVLNYYDIPDLVNLVGAQKITYVN